MSRSVIIEFYKEQRVGNVIFESAFELKASFNLSKMFQNLQTDQKYKSLKKFTVKDSILGTPDSNPKAWNKVRLNIDIC